MDIFSHFLIKTWGTTQRAQKEGLEFGIEEYDEIDKYCKDKIINKSLKVMIYAYVGSQMSKKSSELLKELDKGGRK